MRDNKKTIFIKQQKPSELSDTLKIEASLIKLPMLENAQFQKMKNYIARYERNTEN